VSGAASEALALAVAGAFRIPAAARAASRLGSGHIHDTFAVFCDDPERPRVVLQRINAVVFPDPLLVVENAARIARHLEERLPRDLPDRARRCLRPIETRAGGFAHERAGGTWRAFAFVPGSESLDRVDRPERARAAARAFGAFAAGLVDFPLELRDTLPGFHDFEARAHQFETAVSQDRCARAAAAAAEIESLREARRRLAAVLPPDARAALPLRWVHNDCKLNNVLFDARTGEALCVIDLDTVMRGSLLADFGDLVRTAVCFAPEDARDPAEAEPVPELYRALARGYLEGTAEILTPAELDALPLAGPLITLETALRFASDHLAGDRYFRVERPGQNLDRARTGAHLTLRLLDQLELARELLTRSARDLR
jgi:Ser/Thr protein kinase RdoA (MazF antagonist)